MTKREGYYNIAFLKYKGKIMIRLENGNATIHAEFVGEVVKITTVNSTTNEKLYTDRIPIPTMKLHQAIMNSLDKDVK